MRGYDDFAATMRPALWHMNPREDVEVTMSEVGSGRLQDSQNGRQPFHSSPLQVQVIRSFVEFFSIKIIDRLQGQRPAHASSADSDDGSHSHNDAAP